MTIPELGNDVDNLLLLFVFYYLVRLVMAHIRGFDFHYLYILFIFAGFCYFLLIFWDTWFFVHPIPYRILGYKRRRFHEVICTSLLTGQQQDLLI